MIQDGKQWDLGVSKLTGFMKHVREPFDEGHVEQFHGIVTILEGGHPAKTFHTSRFPTTSFSQGS
jgi:hypothetical protein